MIKLLAHDPRDGAALACDAQGQHFLLHPPYEEADRHPVDAPTGLRLILDHQLPVDAREFADWVALAQALSTELARRALAQQEEVGRWRAVLMRTTAARARTHLQKVEDWIKQGETDIALQVLPVFLLAPPVTADQELVKQIAEMQIRAQERGRQLTERRKRSRAPTAPWTEGALPARRRAALAHTD